MTCLHSLLDESRVGLEVGSAAMVEVGGSEIPRTESLYSSFLLCIVARSSPIGVVSTVLPEAYRSTMDGFRRRPLERGLSKVDADEPDTNEGVRTVGGGCKPLWRYTDADGRPAGCKSDGGATETLRDAVGGGLYAAVTGVGVLLVLFVPCSPSSDDGAVRLALFANFDTCCVVMSCLLSAG